MECKLLNVHNFHSNAKNKDYSIIQIIRHLSSREKNQGYIGSEIGQEIFLPDALVGSVGLSDIGTTLDLVYEVYGNKAELVEIIKKGGK